MRSFYTVTDKTVIPIYCDEKEVFVNLFFEPDPNPYILLITEEMLVRGDILRAMKIYGVKISDSYHFLQFNDGGKLKGADQATYVDCTKKVREKLNQNRN